MAKVTGPLMSLDASGTVGNTATFSKWKGRNYVRLRVIPTNRKTDDQAAARAKLGVVGYMLSFVLSPTKANSFANSQFWADGVANAPAGQSWISYAVRTILGTAFSTWDAAASAYAGIGSTPHTTYETAAGSLGLSSFNISYGAQSAVTAGEQLYHMVKFAIDNLGYVLSAGTLDVPDAGGLSDFVDYVNMAV